MEKYTLFYGSEDSIALSILHKLIYTFSPAAAKSLQSCPTLRDPIDSSPPGFPVPGILQARTLEWVAISLSSAWKWKVKVKLFIRVRLLATPWTAAYQAPPSMDSPGKSAGVECHCLLRMGYYSVIKNEEVLPFVTTKKMALKIRY